MNQCEGQLSLFDTCAESQECLIEKYLKKAIQRGSGFAGGKQRIAKLYADNLTVGERAARIKDEYGQGGSSWGTENGCGLSGWDTFHNGLKIIWKDHNKDNEKIFSWSQVEKVIGNLIAAGEY